MGNSAETMFLLVDYYAETMLLLLGSKASLQSMASARASFFPFRVRVRVSVRG